MTEPGVRDYPQGVLIFSLRSLCNLRTSSGRRGTHVFTRKDIVSLRNEVCVCYPSPHEYITVKFYHRLWIPSKISTSIRITHLTYKANKLEIRCYSFLKIEEGNPHKYESWWRGPNLIVIVIQSLSPIPSRNHGKQYATWLWVRIIWWTSLKVLATFTQTMQQVSDKTVQQLNWTLVILADNLVYRQ